ncbi:aldo/keto reductase [Sinomonas terrae]|uniref:Aldo/keto reductase n=1 Tax=Sinomonas terrae TaxID=2908838 RepID=A0ABS9U1J4_9MICC|nr:aldo/keto reductase [Sinomonas terrae]MCH6470292.1 aldo/keto reductase [Sinomonas terrae]
MTQSPSVTLSAGVDMPQLGFGLYKVPAEDAARLAGEALSAGYRSLDTAAMYGNEAGVGRAVVEAADGGLPREDVFVTTKVWNSDQGYDPTLRAFDRSLSALGLDYVDLYLIHWPCPARGLFVETYRALERLLEDGRVRAIGVSNFQPEHLRLLAAECTVMPAVNQVELHPWLQQDLLKAVHAELGIRTEAWSPLGRGRILEDPVITDIAAAHGVSPAQAVIRWHLQCGHIVIPKASSAARIRENADVFGFELTADDLDRIAGLERGQRTGSDPNEVN